MKTFIGVILLLVFSATQVRGNCIFGHQFVKTGYHTARPCMKMHCDERGLITMYRCPKFICKAGPAFWMEENDTKPYPHCCAQPICRGLEPAIPVYV